MGILFLPDPRFATLIFVVSPSALYKLGQELMGHYSLSGWATNSLL